MQELVGEKFTMVADHSHKILSSCRWQNHQTVRH
nr:MAG TPA: hypothetical protein [Caudoviricetes sp.]